MKKLLTIVLSLAMVFSMTAVSFADTTYEDQGTVTITKVYKETNEGTASPAEDFGFSALVCTSVTDGGVLADGSVITADYVNNNGLIPTISVAEFEQGAASVEGTEAKATITLPDYPVVGIYTYTFTEVDGKTAGVTYYGDTITLKVTVIEQGGKIRVAAVHTEGENEAKSDKFENVYSAGSLDITKTVAGILGDKTKDFNVTVTFTAPEGDTVREAITYVDDGITKTIAAGWNTTATATIDVKNGETVSFTNIPYGVTYTVVEDSYAADGYQTPVYTFGDDAKKIDSAKDTVGIKNVKEGDVDTGIIMDNGIYILLLAGAAAGVGLFIARRRNSFES